MNIPAPYRGARLDHAVTETLRAAGHDVSIREVRRALKAGSISVDGGARAPGERARGGEAVHFERFVPRREALVPADAAAAARAPILFEDEHLLALAKPSGMSSAPLIAHETGTLLSAAIAHAPVIGAFGPPLEGGLLHRLDLETSGVVLFAKDEVTRRAIRDDFARGRVVKRYLAIAADPGGALQAQTTVEGLIVQSGARVRLLSEPTRGALPSRTEFAVLERFPGFALVEAITRTGRRHQIRVHLASLGAPIAGDPIYGPASEARSVAERHGVGSAEFTSAGYPSSGEARSVAERHGVGSAEFTSAGYPSSGGARSVAERHGVGSAEFTSAGYPSSGGARGVAERPFTSRLALHAASVQLRDRAPIEAPLPSDLVVVLDALRAH